MKIAVIGSCMVDLIAYTDTIPKAGETLVAKEFAMGCGGKGANQAVAASKLGADVLMMGRVGDDAFAANTLNNFESYGVSTRVRDQSARRLQRRGSDLGRCGFAEPHPDYPRRQHASAARPISRLPPSRSKPAA
jgi:hypothetical protein